MSRRPPYLQAIAHETGLSIPRLCAAAEKEDLVRMKGGIAYMASPVRLPTPLLDNEREWEERLFQAAKTSRPFFEPLLEKARQESWAPRLLPRAQQWLLP